MEKTYYDALIENIEDENKAYAEEREALKERKSTRIKNLKIRQKNMRKFIAKVAITGGIVLAAITKGDDVIRASIDWDNKNFQEETDRKLKEVQELTGKTIDEILNGQVDYDELKEQAEDEYESEKTK